jgi:hypothetical protein
MPRSIPPVKNCNGANVDANAISGADFPVDSHVGSMNPLFLRRFNRTPDVVSVVLTNYLPILLEIRIYWQRNSTCPLPIEGQVIRLSAGTNPFRARLGRDRLKHE